MKKNTNETKQEKREEKNPNNVIFIKMQKELIKINLEDILTITGAWNESIINTGNKKYTVAATLKEVMKKLPGNDFIRIQRDCIVRFDKIDRIKNNVCVVNNKKLDVTRRLKPRLIKRLAII